MGRLGGDEFGVILSHSEDEETKGKAEALVDAIRAAPFEWEGETIDIQVAFGAYTFSPARTQTTPWPPPTGPCTRTRKV